MELTTEKLILCSGIALMQKRAAVQTQGLDSADKKLHEESNKQNTGSAPAVATDATGQANAATFDVADHPKKPSPKGGNTVEDNGDSTPRNKTASLSGMVSRSLSDLVSKEAAACLAGDGDKKLEEESDKLNLGGAPEGNVESAQISDKNPDPVSKGGEQSSSGDTNEDTVGRVHKQASDNAVKGIFDILKRM